MNRISVLSVVILLIHINAFSKSIDNRVLPDTTKVEIRQLDEDVLNTLKADPDMEYGRSPSAVNLWERFKRWLNNLISSLFNAAVSANWFNIFIVILSAIVLIYVILRLLKVDALNMFYTGKRAAIPHGVLDEDIHAMDFDTLINDALQKNEYRLAIRLLFLKSLKLLADKQHILWQPGKTNHDYLNELTAQNLKTGFNELNFYFEYAWYGNFIINEALYKKANDLYNDWKTNV
ncbi:MAG: DUF4129 domain-containing protein [Cyclobacteriaceae bacterium]|nr:DUF4129 domain-containing protein [Cyclobacteriaceae bacterium]